MLFRVMNIVVVFVMIVVMWWLVRMRMSIGVLIVIVICMNSRVEICFELIWKRLWY